MGLGIRTEDEIYRVYSIPLVWEDNKIIADHLRMLANVIESEVKDRAILTIRLATPISGMLYAKPNLEVVTLDNER